MIFLSIFFLLQSIVLCASSSLELSGKDVFLNLSKCIINDCRGVHEFLPGSKDLFGSFLGLKDNIQFQNGAIVNLQKKEFIVFDLLNLSLTSKRMQGLFEKIKVDINDYWLKQRCLADKKREKSFQTAFKNVFQERNINPLSYVQVIESHQKKSFGEMHQGISLGNPNVRSEDLFDSQGLLFIGISSEGLSYFCSNVCPDTLKATQDLISRFFFRDDYRNADPINCNKDVIFLITAGLSFFIQSFSSIELEQVKQRFLSLNTLFNFLTFEQDEWKDKRVSLANIKYPDNFKDFDQDKQFTFLWNATKAIFFDFLGIQANWIQYEKDLFDTFSNEKKLLFLYCIALIGDRGSGKYNPHHLREIRDWMFKSFCLSVRHLLKQKYKEVVSDFFIAMDDPSLRYCVGFNKLLALLLSVYDVPIFCSFFKHYKSADYKICVLQSANPNLSYMDIATHFYLFIKEDWQEQFKSIAQLKMLTNHGNNKQVVELSQKCCSFEQDIKSLGQKLECVNVQFDKYKAKLDQKRENIKRINKEKIILEKKYNELEQSEKNLLNSAEKMQQNMIITMNQERKKEIKNINTERLGFRNKLLKIFIAAQVCLILAYSVFFKYMSYRRSCAT